MEKKVYEGYKRTSSNVGAANAKTSVTENSTVKKAISPRTTTRKPNARMASKSSINKPRLAMFIDVDNAGISRENLLEILFFANGKYQIELCKLYGFSDETLPGIQDFATEYNVVTVGRMKFKQPGVNCLDSRLLIDAYECALNNKSKIDMIFVWCYPCDLDNLFEKINKLGINTATIDNSVFDCKNKFVSQTFKLYSPYNFSLEQTTYGKVKNEPAISQPSTNLETDQKSTIDGLSQTTTEVPEANEQSQPKMIDGVIPPVLPRRTVLERSNSNTPKTEPEPEATEQVHEEDATQPTSLVEEIARKLNLQVPGNEEIPTEDVIENTENDDEGRELFMAMLKQAGLDDLVKEKPLKYEDTIGDL